MTMRRWFAALLVALLTAVPAFAQQRTVTGQVTNEAGLPIEGAQIGVQGTTVGTTTAQDGKYTVRAAPGQVLIFRMIGHAPEQRQVPADGPVNITLRAVAANLNAAVVTALGQTTTQRVLGTAQQTVQGAEIAQTQRENFINALQEIGRAHV